jgi:predicted metalloprotease with PDZ domain
VTYGKERTDLLKTIDGETKGVNLAASIGLVLGEDGKVVDVVPGKAADKAGLGPHMKVLAVNGRRLSADRLREAAAATAGGKEKLELLAENGEFFRSFALEYAGGERYPHLERDATVPDRIGDIFKPKAK